MVQLQVRRAQFIAYCELERGLNHRVDSHPVEASGVVNCVGVQVKINDRVVRVIEIPGHTCDGCE